VSPVRPGDGDRRAAAPSTDPALLEVGLRPGDVVRYRRREGGTWHEAVVERRERDGSIGVRDERGAARALLVERLQVRTTGARGGTVWEPVTIRADRDEQLGLF
jgi:hypothetical protein